MKYAIGIGLFVLGGSIGYLIGSFDPKEETVDGAPAVEYITETVQDTIVETKYIETSNLNETIDTTEETVDSLFLSDSLQITQDLDSGDVEGDITIRREILKNSIWLNVKVLKEVEVDTLIEEMMGIDNSFPQKILIEFWESPLQFSGYKFSRNKLVLYGLPTETSYKIYRKQKKYYLTTENIYYSLAETEEFLPYLEVEKSTVFND
ncbi:MAG: hypothetical protein ABJG68_16030 [Crocinitomicaceae bacterium]